MPIPKNRPLTTKDLVAIFDVTPMTILNWRTPAEGARKAPLPFTIQGVSVLFNATKIKAWANKHGVPMKIDPLDVADGSYAPKVAPPAKKAKPGPKPTVKRTAAWKKQIDRDVRKATEEKRDRDRINSKHEARKAKSAEATVGKKLATRMAARHA